MPPKRKAPVATTAAAPLAVAPNPTPAPLAQTLAAYTFSDTGGLEVSRSELLQLITGRGGQLVPSAGPGVQYLVTNVETVMGHLQEPNTDIEEAVSRGIHMISVDGVKALADNSFNAAKHVFVLPKMSKPTKTQAKATGKKTAPASASTAAPAPKQATKKSNASGTKFAFAISGTLSATRAEIKKRIASVGAKYVDSGVTNVVTHLISTEAEVDNGTAKVLQAQAKDIPIVSEEFLNALLRGEDPDEGEYLIGEDASAKKPAKKVVAHKKAAAAKKAAAKKVESEDEDDDDDGMDPPEQLHVRDHLEPLTLMGVPLAASNGRTTAHGSVSLYGTNNGFALVRKACRDADIRDGELAALKAVRLVDPTMRNASARLTNFSKLNGLMQRGQSFHYPVVLETDEENTEDNHVLNTGWDGVFLSRFVKQQPTTTADMLKLLLQLMWALMAPAELLNMRHADLHAGNIVIKRCPANMTNRIRMSLELLPGSLPAADLKAKHGDDAPQAASLCLEFDTPYTLTLVDWARVAPADLYFPLPDTFRPLLTGMPKRDQRRYQEQQAIALQQDVNCAVGAATVSQSSPSKTRSPVRRPRPSSSSSDSYLLQQQEHSSYSAGVDVSIVLNRARSILDAFPPICGETLGHLFLGANQRGVRCWIELVMKVASFRETGCIAYAGRHLSYLRKGANQYAMRHFAVEESIELLVCGIATSAPTPRPRGRPRLYASRKECNRAYYLRKKARLASQADPTASEQRALDGPYRDVAEYVYDTAYVLVAPSTIQGSRLGLFARVDVPAGVPLTKLPPNGWRTIRGWYSAGWLVQRADGTGNASAQGDWIVATEPIAKGKEILMNEA